MIATMFLLFPFFLIIFIIMGAGMSWFRDRALPALHGEQFDVRLYVFAWEPMDRFIQYAWATLEPDEADQYIREGYKLVLENGMTAVWLRWRRAWHIYVALRMLLLIGLGVSITGVVVNPAWLWGVVLFAIGFSLNQFQHGVSEVDRCMMAGPSKLAQEIFDRSDWEDEYSRGAWASLPISPSAWPTTPLSERWNYAYHLILAPPTGEPLEWP